MAVLEREGETETENMCCVLSLEGFSLEVSGGEFQYSYAFQVCPSGLH